MNQYERDLRAAMDVALAVDPAGVVKVVITLQGGSAPTVHVERIIGPAKVAETVRCDTSPEFGSNQLFHGEPLNTITPAERRKMSDSELQQFLCGPL